MDRMVLKETLAGNTTARAHWANDSLSECNHEDALWGFAIRASEELEKTLQTQVDDLVLYRLFHMGLFNWSGKNKLQEMASQGVRFAAVVATRLFARILRMEEKVRSPLS